MSKKGKMKIIVDMMMTITLILLMSYALVGETTHEILGCLMFILFIIHHGLNIAWAKNLTKGKYNHFRIYQTVLVVFILLCMLTQMLTGIVLSKKLFVGIFSFLSPTLSRSLHMLGSYWGFLFMSLHLGLHVNSMKNIGKKSTAEKSKNKSISLGMKALMGVVLVYGLYAFVKRDIPIYMTLQTMYVAFDFNEPRIFFFMDYVAIMIAFTILGNYMGRYLREE